jgi:nucleoside-diphosphate-sugar epimerase
VRNRVLVTGATGFIGSAVVDRLISDGRSVTTAVRRAVPMIDGVRAVVVDGLHRTTDWTIPLTNCSTVIHCAARVHIMREGALDPLSAFRAVNVVGTQRLAEQAAASGVRRFIYISSIKVNGEETILGSPFRESDTPMPIDPYGVSKLEAECALKRLAEAGAFNLTIVRPPLVYGPGVKANFRTLMKMVASGVPLPLGSITNNRRSYVALANLVDLIVTVLESKQASGQTFLVSDGEDLSTADLLKRTAAVLGVRPRFLPVPERVMALSARILRQEGIWTRLAGSLQVDLTSTIERLHWRPPVTVDDALRATVAGLAGYRVFR